MADVANRPNRCGDTRLVHLLTFLLTVDAQTGGQVDCSALNGRTNHASLPPPSRLFIFPLSAICASIPTALCVGTASSYHAI